MNLKSIKKAIDDSEGEWADNKKLVDLSKRGGDVRRVIPKGFSYFAVDFGLQPGYAHVIENENKFPQNFAHVRFWIVDLIVHRSTLED